MPFMPQQQQPQMPQHQSEQMPPIPASMMSPPRPEIPQFRLINPAPQQPNFDRPQEQEIDSPMPRPEVRIQLRRIQLPGPIGDIFPFLNNIQNNIQNDMQKEMEAPRPAVQVQQVPLAVALSKVGITPDDLRNIQRMAEERFQQHIRELVADEDDSSSGDSDSNQSDEDEDVKDMNMPTVAAPEEKSVETKEEVAEEKQEKSEEERPQVLALNRASFGRSLQNQPIQLPIRPEIQEAERADCKTEIYSLLGIIY
jgi:hypothetical protein